MKVKTMVKKIMDYKKHKTWFQSLVEVTKMYQ
jgi:hypothetical protein